jgi:hypothetical protein
MCIAVLAVTAAALLAACQPAEKGRTSRSPAAENALVAYRGLWRAFVEAAKTSHSTDPRLRTHATGDALNFVTHKLYDDWYMQIVTQGDVALSPRVTRAQSTEVLIIDCVDATNWREYRTVNGELPDNASPRGEPSGKHRTTATVTFGEGVWKVSAFTYAAPTTC